jgi:hypothetical protein
MFAVQQPLRWSALEEVMGVPAWKALSTNHVAMVSHPEEVLELITTAAAQAVSAT